MNEATLTEQLQRFSTGDRVIAEDVLREVLPKLRQIAFRQLDKEHRYVPLVPTELVNEVWLRNLSRGGYQIRDRNHFYSIAARAMRLFLVDVARHALSQSHGAGLHPVALDEANDGHHPASTNYAQVLEIGLLLEKLEGKDPAAARVVDLHHVVGFTLEEIAENTGLTLRQVRHRWRKGSDWLKRHLKT